ncbi:DUF3662 and FHA domain-containing protein [Conexibacter sp. DBS9H8]|uniref:FhaA domain-containing protein n=1 Tax=Conexibacter sp. DBS9H8 TaxID=2937801 RepID=UPI00200E91D7|nr:DUF3662 and FHA domain-containing protein [Conexibacter sp. DBS9H8]
MSLLDSLESKIASLVEGTFNRVFKSEVRPVEIARKLAREMEEHRTYSLSHTYVPNDYRVHLSPRDHERFLDFEDALAAELAGYLLEHARREGFSLLSTPKISFATDPHLGLGEFGIETRTVSAEDAEGHDPAPPSTVYPAAEEPAGATMIYSTAARVAEPLAEIAVARARRATLLHDGRRLAIPASGVTIGRSRQCEIVIDDPNVSRRHAEVRPRGGAWVLTDLESTNGSLLNGRRIRQPESLSAGDEIEIGTSLIRFELE